MKTVERILALLLFALVFINQGEAQDYQKNMFKGTLPPSTVRKDTIVKKDTIVVREVVSRTDVVHRTETVVRIEGTPEEVARETILPVNDISFERINDVSFDRTPVESYTPANDISFDRSYSYSDYPANDISFDSDEDEVCYPYREGGDYVWVPDSLRIKVNQTLSGRDLRSWKKTRKEEDFFDPDEKVTFRGDTLPMVLRSRNLGRYDRGLFNFLFIPKGMWQLGITASYGEFTTSNLEILDLVSDIDFTGKIFSVRPYFACFIRNNISLGMRLGYTHGEASIGAFNMEIDEDMSFNLHDIMYKSNSYSAAVTFAQYLGIARKGRFGVFNEVELALSGGNSDFNRPYNGEMRKTHTTSFQAALNFSPGVCVYILDELSFNVSLGVFGLNIRHEKQKVNGEELGWRTTSGANFRFNIFNINFGIAVNI